MARRLAVLALAVCVLLAGCGGGGDERVVASASPATVDASALEATGYERVAATNRTLNTTVRASISGDVKLNAEQPVSVTTPLWTYRRATEAGPAVVVVAAAPAVRPIENQPVVKNPLLADGTLRLVTGVQSAYDVESLAERANNTVTLLGNETAAPTHVGPATHNGQSVDVRVTVATVRDGEDFVTVVAVAPTRVDEGERFQRLLDGVTH